MKGILKVLDVLGDIIAVREDDVSFKEWQLEQLKAQVKELETVSPSP